MKLKNNAGNNPYIYACPWCDAPAGCLCRDMEGKEYTDGSYHRARLMKDCLNLPIENMKEWIEQKDGCGAGGT